MDFALRKCFVNKYKISENIKILTIGQIRDVESNVKIIDSFGNDKRVTLNFVGIGSGVKSMMEYCREKGFNNVSFFGRYSKENESDFVQSCDMVNCYLSRNINSDTCMSNRFYQSIVFRKPIIVNEGCFQASLVTQYKLGVVLKENMSFCEQILSYWNSFDREIFENGCRDFAYQVKQDVLVFEQRLLEIIT